jgi:transcriptional regulatory protein LEU3
MRRKITMGYYCDATYVHAMLLICTWPFPTSSMSTDTSFILAGIAKNAAVHIGLHRPEILQDFSGVKCQLGPRELQEAVKVRAECYIAAKM